VLRWHRDLIARRHARISRPARVGRPRTIWSIRRLVLRLARENRRVQSYGGRLTQRLLHGDRCGVRHQVQQFGAGHVITAQQHNGHAVVTSQRGVKTDFAHFLAVEPHAEYRVAHRVGEDSRSRICPGVISDEEHGIHVVAEAAEHARATGPAADQLCTLVEVVG
jgi:hypothetical protein